MTQASGQPKPAGSSLSGSLPNLIIIGAAKCGTTSLHNYLAVHPEMFMSEIKELDFFTDDETWAKGVDWYRRQFPSDAKVRGESSTSYTRGDGTATTVSRMGEVLDHVKLIYMVRDPIPRISSDYHQHHTVGVDERSLAEALAEPNNRYVQASSYATQLEPYVQRFGMENILVETQERLLKQRRASLRRIFGFLEVDDDVDREEFDRIWERSEGKGWAYSLGWRVRQRGIRLPNGLRWPAQRLQRSRLFGGAAQSARPPELDEAMRAAVTKRLQPEVDRLREMTGLSFEEWSL